MANYTCTTDMTLEACIAAGPMTSGDTLYIRSGAVVTCDRTPSILMGRVYVEDGKLLIDGVNIGAGNMINFVGEYLQVIEARGQGTLDVNGAWYNLGTTDGTASQTFNLTTYYDKGGSLHCVDVVPMIQVETGRRINFDTVGTGSVTPEVDDFVRKVSSKSTIGRIIEVQATYLIVRYFTGSLADDDDIEIQKVVDNEGPDMQIAWTAKVNHASGDIKEAGIYQEFGNAYANNVNRIGDFHFGVGGFVFANAFQSTTITMGSATTPGTLGGFMPPTGCNVRIPNVHFSTSDITNYTLTTPATYHDGTAVEGNWYNLQTGYGGNIELSTCNMGSAWFGTLTAYVFDAEYVGATVDMGSQGCATKVIYNHCVVVSDLINSATATGAFRLNDCMSGAKLDDCMLIYADTHQNGLRCDSVLDLKVNGCIVSTPNVQVSATASVYCSYITQCDDVVVSNSIFISGDELQADQLFYLNNNTNLEMRNLLVSASQDETIPTTRFIYGFYIYNCKTNTKIVGIQILGHGVPGYRFFYLNDCANMKFRCMGMIDSKIDCSTVATRMFNLSGNCNNIDIARIWKDNGSSEELIYQATNTKNLKVWNCSGKYVSNWNPGGNDNISFRGLHGGADNPGTTNGIEDFFSVRYGRQIADGFRSDTVGFITCNLLDPSGTINNTTVVSGNPKFQKDGTLDMLSGDAIDIEQDYFAKGHVSFPGTYTSVVSSAIWGADEWTNVGIQFQWMLDGGSWNASWLDARTPTNWTGITGNIKAGIKLKFRFTATGTQTAMTMFIIDTTTTLADQKANFYPIDQEECDVTLNNIVAGSTYYIYDADSSLKLFDGTAAATSVVHTCVVPDKTNLLIRVRKASADPKYKPFETTGITTTTTLNIPIAQIFDPNA